MKKFVDDPKAVNEILAGRIFPRYHQSKYVSIGVPLTLEQAKAIHRKDINQQNLFKASFQRKVTKPKIYAQKAYYWRNREKILDKLQTKKKGLGKEKSPV